MKLNSLARFRRRRRFKKILLILAALFIGFVIAAESRFAFTRLWNITVYPPDALPQHAVWGILTPRQERFWPAFFFTKGEYEKLLESYYPVTAQAELRGWGNFRLTVKPLVPIYKVYWGGKFWYLANDGKLWLSSLSENKILDEHNADNLPVLAWSADRATPIDISQTDGNVYGSSMPIPLINGWYRMAEELGWMKYIKFIQAGVREGRPVVRLIFYAPDNTNGAQLLLPNEAESWAESGLAVKKLYSNISNMPRDIFIDCTYKGKILLRNLGENKPAETKEDQSASKQSAAKNKTKKK